MVNGAYESLTAPVIALRFGTPFAAPRMPWRRRGAGIFLNML
jgi:hypothetical protein